jgi:hypothetical protein
MTVCHSSVFTQAAKPSAPAELLERHSPICTNRFALGGAVITKRKRNSYTPPSSEKKKKKLRGAPALSDVDEEEEVLVVARAPGGPYRQREYYTKPGVKDKLLGTFYSPDHEVLFGIYAGYDNECFAMDVSPDQTTTSGMRQQPLCFFPSKAGGAPLDVDGSDPFWRICTSVDSAIVVVAPPSGFADINHVRDESSRAMPVSMDPGCGLRALHWLLPPAHQQLFTTVDCGSETTAADLDVKMANFGLTLEQRPLPKDPLFSILGNAEPYCWLLQASLLEKPDIRHWLAVDASRRVVFVGLVKNTTTGVRKNMFW